MRFLLGGLHGLVIPCIVTILLLEAWRFQQAYKKLEIRSADDFYDLLKYGKKKDNHSNDESIQEFKKIGSMVSIITVFLFLFLMSVSFILIF